MSIKTRRLMGSMVALLAAVTVGAVLLAGTALAQGGQRNTPANGWGRGMMGGHRGYSMHATAPITDTTTYDGWRRGMMGPMLYGMWGTNALTNTTTYGGHCGAWGRGMMEGWHRGMGGWSYPDAGTPPTQVAPSGTSGSTNPVDGDLPENVEAALETADPARGQQVALSTGCIGCHTLNSEVRMVGPTWENMAETATMRVPGASVETYLYQSIINPNAYIVPGFPANIMPQTYGQALNDQDLADLIAYLLTLGESKN